MSGFSGTYNLYPMEASLTALDRSFSTSTKLSFNTALRMSSKAYNNDLESRYLNTVEFYCTWTITLPKCPPPYRYFSASLAWSKSNVLSSAGLILCFS
jgi:hypothetical protein